MTHPNRPSNPVRPSHRVVRGLQRIILWLSKYWLVLANLLAGLVLWLAILAPALMQAGYTNAGQSIYRFFAPHDHQLPHRSYFLFGQNGLARTYSLEQVLAWGADPNNLRAFVGNPNIGYKTALNHRMLAIFTGIFFGGLVWGLRGGRPRLGPVPFLLMTLPLLVDGFSHLYSETRGLGFRETNAWAVALTGGVFPDWFYTGSTFGTLNWLLRTATGLLFGLGLVWFLYTYMSLRFALMRNRLQARLGDRSS